MRALIGLFLTLSCSAATIPVLAFEARGGKYVSRVLSVSADDAVLRVDGHTVRMTAAGASRRTSLEALDRMPGKANYIPGGSCALYGRVRWRGVYPGVDVVFHGNQQQLEYDLGIGAWRDRGRIRLAFDGVDSIQVDPNGDLVLRAGAAVVRQPQPFAYQVVAGEKRPVDAAYRIDASKHVGFRTGAYDHARALVIDPQIVFDKPFGGSGDSLAAGLARDAQGNLYVTGATNSTDFGTINGFQSHLGTPPLLVTGDGGDTWSYPSLAGASGVRAMAAAPSTTDDSLRRVDHRRFSKRRRRDHLDQAGQCRPRGRGERAVSVRAALRARMVR